MNGAYCITQPNGRGCEKCWRLKHLPYPTQRSHKKDKKVPNLPSNQQFLTPLVELNPLMRIAISKVPDSSYNSKLLTTKISNYEKEIGFYYCGTATKSLSGDSHSGATQVEHSFEKNPDICPECSTFMIRDVVSSFLAYNEIKKLVKTM